MRAATAARVVGAAWLPATLAALLAACTCGGPPGGGPTRAEAGPKRLHLLFTGNVHGELEPCG